MSKSSSWNIIGRELLFYCIICPIFIGYVAIQAAIGITLLIPVIIATATKSWKWMARLKNPWREIAVMATRMWLHVRCTYYQEFVPWNEARKAKKAKAAKPAPHVEWSPPTWDVSPSASWSSYYNGESVVVLAIFMFQSLISLVAIVDFIYSAILVLSVWGIQRYYTEAPVVSTTPPEPPKVEVYQQQVADKQETDFGPWSNSAEVMDERSKASFLNLALISDTGIIKYSQRYTSGTAGFTPYVSEHIADAHVDGNQVTFHDERHNKLHINVGQVFLFENDAVRAYQFSTQGTLLSTRNFKPQEIKK
jgi:hypothetical protein